MKDLDLAIDAILAGTLLIAMPVLDVVVGIRDPGPVHGIVGFSACVVRGRCSRRCRKGAMK